MSSLLETPATSAYHSEPGLTLYLGDAATVLAELPADSVHCAITSPPYFGLRDYGVEGQIGMEDTLDEYVERLVLTFRALRRVLRPDGVFWLNIADRFVDKQVLPVSWTVALALQQDGWLLRAPVVWHKPNAIPSSAKDRPGLDYEHVFMLTKTKHNYFDMEAVHQEAKWERWGAQTVPKYAGSQTGTGWMTERSKEDIHASVTDENGKRWRNLRTVWTIPTSNYPGAHFATFPPALVERCILATCPAAGVVLDPFIGSGTVAMQARKMDRRAIGIDLKAEYLDQTLTRVRQRR